MTGTIVALAADSRTGAIRMEDGSLLAFSGSAVLGDFDSLQIGDRVSFDAERDRSHYIAVRVFREPFSLGGKHGAPPDLRYAGFDQENNLRVYRFDAISLGRSVRYCVTVDMTLLLKHHIGVQEAPALCLRKLATDLKSASASGRHRLDESDLEAFASSRAAALQRRKPKQAPRRGSPPPGPFQDSGAR
ncbi:MAG: hypothetical protein ACM3S5_04230 [Rhodospirillales bacterium]